MQVIFLHERPDEHQIRSMMTQVFEAVKHLHSKGIAHNDLKALNILRMDGGDKHLRLIDLDAATEIDGDSDLLSFVGAKFSSGILPPKCSTSCPVPEVEQFSLLLLCLASRSDGARRRSLSPSAPRTAKTRSCGRRSSRSETTGLASFVVKTFLPDPSGRPALRRENAPLPYDLVASSSAIDIWSPAACSSSSPRETRSSRSRKMTT